MPVGVAAAALGAPAKAAATSLRRIDRDTVIAEDIHLAPSEGFDIAAGATLTLRGGFEAPPSRVFQGPGRVDLTASRAIWARPEWWGAVPGDGAVDCAPAIEAALKAHLWVQLGAGDYWLARTLRIVETNRRLWGTGRVVDAGGTRLVLRGSGGAVVAVGSPDSPGGINDFLRGVGLRAMVLGRSEPPVAGAIGLRARHILQCNFEGLAATEHATGFDIRMAVRSFFTDCSAFRSLGGGGDDVFTGFAMEGAWPVMPGVNASLFLIDCTASVGGSPRLAASHGIRLTQAFADTFIVRFESTSLTDGIVIDGKGGGRGSHANLRIEAPILDRCFRTGISITNLSDEAAVEIQAPYVALSERGGVCVSIRDSGGAIDIVGGQLIGWVASDAKAPSTGIVADRTHGLGISGLKLVGCAQPLTATGVAHFDIRCSVIGASNPSTIMLRDCANGQFALRTSRGVAPQSVEIRCEGRSRAIAIDTSGSAVVSVGGVRRPLTAGRIEI